ncbi:MAG: T9SS type A sorting domain-containing protein, partial [candidate division Zixibacteria bacterium]|nr:T9SS type A sorting domain-containing protein [candidate division Zixibacteria bacterium]
ASLVASDRDMSFQHNQSRMNRLHSAPKEAKRPLPPDYKLPGEAQKPCQSSAVAGTGAIRGRVTQAPGGTTPIENVYVEAYKLTCPYYYAEAYSDFDGYYIIESLPAGKYAVWTDNDSIFLDIVWNDKPTGETPDTVVVVLNDTTDNINFKLPVGGKITGRVTMLGASFSFVVVDAIDTLSYYEYSVYPFIFLDTASYEIRQLPTGIYKVNIAYTDSFAPEYYNNKPGWASADPIRVKEDSITSNIDFTLALGGKITGTVKLPGADSVSATVWTTDTTTGDSYYCSAYNPSGDSATYEIVGLPTGTYKVNTYNSQGYFEEYYNDKPDWASADPIRVKEDSITSNINFTLALGGKITGTVKLPGASSVSATLSAIDTTTGYPNYWGDASNPSGDSATYEIVGLPTGTYKVYAHNEQGYFDEYYNDKPDYATADTIHVTAGSIRPNINFTLTLGGIIKGNVSSSAKGSLKGVKVYVFYTTNPTSYQDYGSTNSSGDYRIAGLQSRYYKILAYGDTIYAPKYYNNKTSWSSADSVLVPVSDSVLGKNFALEVGGSIKGHVYGDDAVSLSGATVTAFGFFDQFPIERSKTTPADGSYKIGGLPTGYYKVRAYDGCKYIYYNNKPSWDLADSVFVTMPDSVININFSFPTTAVEDEDDQTTRRPAEFELSQNYPNPFNPGTQIEYTLKKTGHVTLHIYNILGEKVKTLLDQDQPAGLYRIDWDGKNDNGKPVSSGIYLYKLEVNGFSEAKRMLLLK